MRRYSHIENIYYWALIVTLLFKQEITQNALRISNTIFANQTVLTAFQTLRIFQKPAILAGETVSLGRTAASFTNGVTTLGFCIVELSSEIAVRLLEAKFSQVAHWESHSVQVRTPFASDWK
jgi:hypothetical protein